MTRKFGWTKNELYSLLEARWESRSQIVTLKRGQHIGKSGKSGKPALDKQRCYVKLESKPIE